MFGVIGQLLSVLTIPQMIQFAVEAPTIIAEAKKLGEDLAPVIKQIIVDLKASAHPQAATAHQHWSSAWTEADQRAADFQDGSRG